MPRRTHTGVPADHLVKGNGRTFHDPEIARVAAVAAELGATMRTAVPLSSGIGAPANGQSPGSLANSPIAAQAAPQAPAKIPFVRASSLATMQDAQINAMVAGQPVEVNLQTNAFLEFLSIDVQIVAVNAAATVKWNPDGPWAVFGLSGIQLTDSANLNLIQPISGFKLAQLNKFLGDTDCTFDPARDSGFTMLPTAANNATGSVATNAGSANFRLIVPIEIRRRDALGAVTNSAGNEPMRLTLTPVASYAAGTDKQNNLYETAPDTSVTVNVQIFQTYWTAPPAVIVSGGQSTGTVGTPAGLGTLGFLRSELHKEVAGGGDGPFQLTSVGDVISNIIWTLRTTTATNARDAYTATAGGAINGGYANWPPVFHFSVNDFTTLSLGQDLWIREMSKYYDLTNGISAQAGAPGFLDAGVFTFGPWLDGMFGKAVNFEIGRAHV